MSNATMTAGQVRKTTGVSRSQLRYWESRRIITPTLVTHASRAWRLYPGDQVEKIMALKQMIDDGYSLRGAVRRLNENAVVVAAEMAPALAGACA